MTRGSSPAGGASWIWCPHDTLQQLVYSPLFSGHTWPSRQFTQAVACWPTRSTSPPRNKPLRMRTKSDAPFDLSNTSLSTLKIMAMSALATELSIFSASSLPMLVLSLPGGTLFPLFGGLLTGLLGGRLLLPPLLPGPLRQEEQTEVDSSNKTIV